MKNCPEIPHEKKSTRDGNSTRDSFVLELKKRIPQAEDVFSSGTGIHSAWSSDGLNSGALSRVKFWRLNSGGSFWGLCLGTLFGSDSGG
jgi:hypothetical protein